MKSSIYNVITMVNTLYYQLDNNALSLKIFVFNKCKNCLFKLKVYKLIHSFSQLSYELNVLILGME